MMLFSAMNVVGAVVVEINMFVFKNHLKQKLKLMVEDPGIGLYFIL